MTLARHFRKYNPVVLPGKHTCVGLGMRLLQQLPPEAYLVSCEESIDDVHDYLSDGLGPESVEKEHVMVAMRIVVDDRHGLMLCDPGYHVARVVTIMKDRFYPNTGWFTQSDEPHCMKEYSYSFNAFNPDYVEWAERETRGAQVKHQTSLVYVEREFLNAIDVTERRNLVYNFRSLLARDQKGHLVAGVYFPVVVKDAAFTLFYEDKSVKQRVKYKFTAFLDPDKVPDHTLEQLTSCEIQMGLAAGQLSRTLTKLAKIMSDASFVGQALAINDNICSLSADN